MRLSVLAALLLVLAACAPQGGTGNSSSSASSSSMLTSSASSIVASSASSLSDLIQITAPMPNQTVASPLTITGRARGNWYFEASFPVRLVDAQQNPIAQGIAQAQGDWMTTDFVPFTVTLTFTTTASSGFLILEKDNPSGLPQNDASVMIPVNF